jgi:uncharacterized protein
MGSTWKETRRREDLSKKKSVSKKSAPKQESKPIVVDAMAMIRAQGRAMNSPGAFPTMDGFDNFLSRVGLGADNSLSHSTYTFNNITRNRILLEASYRGSWVVGVVVDAMAEDMTREGIDVTTEEDVDMDEFKNAMSRLQIWQSFCSSIKWGRLYGGGIGVFQIAGQKLDTPLDLDSVGKDQFQGIVVYDRWQLAPSLDDVIDSGPEMGLPKYYNITISKERNGTPAQFVRVHHSRCYRYIGIELPWNQAIYENLWGESELERLWDRMVAFDNATMSAAGLIDRANLRTVGIEGLRDILSAGGEAQKGLEAMFDMVRRMQTNEGLTLLDKEDTMQSTAYSFAGLPETILQFGQQLSGASGIPLVRFFGQSPAGLSATGESDMRMYYDNIKAKQEARLRNPVEILVKVLWRSVFGTPAPKDMKFTFTPLWQQSANDKANNAKTTTETILGPVEAGLVKKSTGLKELRDASGETGVFANITDEEIKEAEETDEDPPMPETNGDPNSVEAQPDEEKPPSLTSTVPSLDAKAPGNKNRSFLSHLRGNA